MIQFIDIPAEQTTAFTDFILAIISLIGVGWIVRLGYKIDKKKTLIWAGAFILLAIAAILGSIAHGIKMTEELNKIIWHPLNLFLGLSVSLFAIGVFYDIQKFKIQKTLVVLILISGFIFFGVTLIVPGLFFVFILYEAIAMLFALISYTFLMIKRKLPGAFYMTLGILISILASVIQSVQSIVINLFWVFDHNGLFHLIQIIGLILLFCGLVKEFRSRAKTDNLKTI